MDIRVFRNDDESVKAYCEVLKFWSNGIGELHCPHKVGLPDITADELPKELKRVFDELYWEPCGGASLRYMVETEKGYGLALLNEYDSVTSESSGVDFGPLFETVVADAKKIAKDPAFEKCEVFAGEQAGFDGCHELIVVVPYNVSVDEFKKIVEKLDDYTYVGCGLNNNQMNNEKGTRNNCGIAVGDDLNGGSGRGENAGLRVDNVESLVADWLQEMRMQEGELIYAKNLDPQSDEYKKMVGLVADLCLREFPDLHEAVFGDGAGTMDLIFKDKWQEGCFKLYYYNRDSSAGGLIEECPFDVVDATEMIGNANYMDVLAEHTHHLSDADSEHFFETIFGFLEMKRDGLYLGNSVDDVCAQIEAVFKDNLQDVGERVHSAAPQGQGPSAKGQGEEVSNSSELNTEFDSSYALSLEEKLGDAKEKSVRFVTDSVVGVGDFVEDDEMRKVLNDSFVLRNKTLDVCYKIPGYEKLPHADKNALYELVKKAIEKDLDIDLGI